MHRAYSIPKPKSSYFFAIFRYEYPDSLDKECFSVVFNKLLILKSIKLFKYVILTPYISIGYHMSGEVISVLSLEGRYYNCHERAQRARDNYNIVTRVIQLISPS